MKLEMSVKNMDIERQRSTIVSLDSEKRMIQKATDNALELIDIQKERINDLIERV